MFKIARTVKQIFNVARNVPKSASASINSMVKYCSQSKGYIEDASEEFTFLKVLPSQSSNASIQDKFSIFTPNPQNIAKPKSTPLLDSAAIRKLIYARFADEIVVKSKSITYAKSQESKEYVDDAVATYSIADEFKALREHGYNFKDLRSAIINHNSSQQSENIEEKNISDNGSGKSLSQRMKELVVSGHISRYSGEAGLKEEVEKVMHQKALVIEEFMQRFTDAMEEEGVELIG
jgi:hypothetical protein